MATDVVAGSEDASAAGGADAVADAALRLISQ